MQHYAKGDARQRRESRSFVTPYQFSVAEDMLGTPLATPTRRATALLVDFALVAMLTHVSGSVLAVFVALVFLQAARQQHSQTLRKTRQFLRVAAVFTLVVVMFDLTDEVLEPLGISIVTEDAEKAEQAEKPASEQAETTMQASSADSEYQAVKDLALTLTNIIKDFGLGLGWAALYFSVLTAWFAGQTPGKKLMGIQVVRLDGRCMNLWESFGRYGGYGAGLATGLMGFAQVFWDPNRQAIQDKISETLVIDTRKPRQSWNDDV